MKEVDAWLTAVILGGVPCESDDKWLTRVKEQLKAKFIESYRNVTDEPANQLHREIGGTYYLCALTS